MTDGNITVTTIDRVPNPGDGVDARAYSGRGSISVVAVPPQTASQRARAAHVATRLHSREAVAQVLARLAETAAEAADVSDLPSLPPGVTEDIARIGETIALAVIRMQAIMRRVG